MRVTRFRLVGAVLAVLVVGAVAVAGVLGVRYFDARATEDARDDVLAAAKSYATTMFGYDPGNVSDHVNRSRAIVTGAAQQQYNEKVVPASFVSEVRKQQIVSQAVIQDAGVVTNTRDSATVLIFMNQSVSRGGKELVRVDPSRLTFAMIKDGDRWLISDISLITDDSFRSRIGETSTAPSGTTPTPVPGSSTPSSAVPTP